MVEVIKLSKPEFEIGPTANTIGNATLFRAYAPTTSKLAVLDETLTEIGSITIPAGNVEVIEKRRTDFVTATSGILLCSPIAYK